MHRQELEHTGKEGKDLVPETDGSKLALALLTVLHAGRAEKK